METIKQMLIDSGEETSDTGFIAVDKPLEETRMFGYGSVLIVFSDKTRVTDREFTKISEYFKNIDTYRSMIIVTPTAPSELVLNSLRRYIADPENALIQIFELRHLGFDISKHRQVPKHKIIQKQELDEFLKEYGLTSQTTHLLPKIDCQDPMAKRIRARPGDVVEIMGLSMTSGEYRRARLCVESV